MGSGATAIALARSASPSAGRMSPAIPHRHPACPLPAHRRVLLLSPTSPAVDIPAGRAEHHRAGSIRCIPDPRGPPAGGKVTGTVVVALPPPQRWGHLSLTPCRRLWTLCRARERR